jgi:hypothetical protein
MKQLLLIWKANWLIERKCFIKPTSTNVLKLPTKRSINDRTQSMPQSWLKTQYQRSLYWQ